MARPVGVDISKHQGNNLETHPDVHGVNFTLLHNKADFIIVRAGYGGSAGGAWLDERVHQFMEDLGPLLRQEPKPFTFYWYFRDDVNIMDQVNLFCSVINKYKDYVNLHPVVDAEVFVKSNLLSTQKIIDFQTEVERQTGLLVDILYGRAAQLNSETTPGLEVVLPYLWVARYADFLDEQVDEPWEEGSNVDPRDYDDWKFWQYSSKGPGGQYGVVSASIDLNVFNGTLDELREWAGLHEPVPPPPDFSDKPFKLVEKAVEVRDTVEIVFEPMDGDIYPQGIQLLLEPWKVEKAEFFTEAGGMYVKFAQLHTRFRDWAWFELPSWFGRLNGDIKIVLTAADGEVSVAVASMVYEEW